MKQILLLTDILPTYEKLLVIITYAAVMSRNITIILCNSDTVGPKKMLLGNITNTLSYQY